MKRNSSNQLRVVRPERLGSGNGMEGWPLEEEIEEALGLTRDNAIQAGTRIDGRSLHRFLGFKKNFSPWMKRYLELCGAAHPEDYDTTTIMRGSNVVARKDYSLSVPLVEKIVKKTRGFGKSPQLAAFIESARDWAGVQRKEQVEQAGFMTMDEDQVRSLGKRILAISSGLTGGEEQVDSYVYLKQQICLHMGASDLASIPESQYDYLNMLLDVVGRYCSAYGNRYGLVKHPLVIRVADGRVVITHKSLPDYVAPFNDSLWKPISENEKKKYEPWRSEKESPRNWKNNGFCVSRILGELLTSPLDIDVATRPHSDGKIQITLNQADVRRMFDHIYSAAEERE